MKCCDCRRREKIEKNWCFHSSDESVKRSERNVACTAVIQQEMDGFGETAGLQWINMCSRKENNIDSYVMLNFGKTDFFLNSNRIQ